VKPSTKEHRISDTDLVYQNSKKQNWKEDKTVTSTTFSHSDVKAVRVDSHGSR
jgi:hypothetical protein